MPLHPNLSKKQIKVLQRLRDNLHDDDPYPAVAAYQYVYRSASPEEADAASQLLLAHPKAIDFLAQRGVIIPAKEGEELVAILKTALDAAAARGEYADVQKLSNEIALLCGIHGTVGRARLQLDTEDTLEDKIRALHRALADRAITREEARSHIELLQLSQKIQLDQEVAAMKAEIAALKDLLSAPPLP